jgi:hypothetical protein
MIVQLAERLLRTRDNLAEVCEELGIVMPEEGSIPAMQCAACSIWVGLHNVRMDEGIPICGFCEDMSIMRF